MGGIDKRETQKPTRFRDGFRHLRRDLRVWRTVLVVAWLVLASFGVFYRAIG